MTISPDPVSFSSTRFVQDAKDLAKSLGAPYSEPAINEVLEVFAECFKNSVVVWRATNRLGDALNYRVFLRHKSDTVAIATTAGYLKPFDPLVKLVESCSLLFNGESEQWCDFDASVAGLTKTWINLRGTRCVDDVLSASAMPCSIRAHGPSFHGLGLDSVTFIAADYSGGTINLYFPAPGPISQDQAARYTNLARSPPPTDGEFQDMLQVLYPKHYHFAVTMDFFTGKITRVAFYALDLPASQAPTMDDRIVKFFDNATFYDKHQTRIVAWSYGLGGSKYMKVESSYTGELSTLGTFVEATA